MEKSKVITSPLRFDPLRISKTFIVYLVFLYRLRLYRHMLLPNEQKLIFDCGFENEMSGREIHDIVHGLVKSFAKNRDHRAPFTMHLCNINTNVSEFASLPQSGLFISSNIN